MESIAVLYTVFNRKECTLLSLERLLTQKGIDKCKIDIYITDGGSTDGTVDCVKEKYPNIKIQVKDGLFWNRGMWESWQWASNGNYDYYLWLNDDTYIYDICIEKLLDTSHIYNDQSIIVGATVDTHTKSIITYGGRLKNGNIAKCTGIDVEVTHFNGNIVLVPKSVFIKLGNLDPYYTHSKGDFDYGIRAQIAGVKIYQYGFPLGECDAHNCIDKWCDPSVPLKQRWRLMNKPNGMPPKETYHLVKQVNIISAILHYFLIYIRCIFPNIWILFKKKH